MKYFVSRIVCTTSLPVSVDLENGYSHKAAKVIENVEALHRLGIAGINIEDSVIDTNCDRQLLELHTFSEIISAISKYKDKTTSELFVNIRTDAFLLGTDNALKETLGRLPILKYAGNFR
ncbi:isocitrate lyase/phosphoenolpyruvate mutase family protein [Fulvivirga sp. 29W222]|uniref:Isocitrate lyase/phosphoenolpyruvate mutase family protein n=1 Tax=Fulvivirga marina TaxID=2494733 RepID=A0A937G6J3_9BACT|nr:isocitrate lyase/phosphoenolpyruvate mutase family protein [Fulvivirga marina]MBL6449351.1 isocitrate lyase/phosphoenolpyruvate mutase family protein [Fulvivirga marina]